MIDYYFPLLLDYIYYFDLLSHPELFLEYILVKFPIMQILYK